MNHATFIHDLEAMAEFYEEDALQAVLELQAMAEFYEEDALQAVLELQAMASTTGLLGGSYA